MSTSDHPVGHPPAAASETGHHRVTVLMPAYNAEKYVGEAVASILNQTCRDFELLVINDGSTDRTAEIVASFDDPRIRLVHNERNLGLVATLNRGLDLATGDYIARMDADDISLPERLEKQVAFLDAHPTVGFCGCAFAILDGPESGHVVNRLTHPSLTRATSFFRYTLLHPTMVMRRAHLAEHGLTYDMAFREYCEDDDLLLRASFCFELANVPDVLFRYRKVDDSYSAKREHKHRHLYDRLVEKRLAALGIPVNETTMAQHKPLFAPDGFASLAEMKASHQALGVLLDRHAAKPIYDEAMFRLAAREKWHDQCYQSTRHGFRAFAGYWLSRHRQASRFLSPRNAKFLVKSLLRK